MSFGSRQTQMPAMQQQQGSYGYSPYPKVGRPRTTRSPDRASFPFSKSVSPLKNSSYVYAFSNQKESATKIGVSTAETGSAWASPSSGSSSNLTGSAKKAPTRLPDRASFSFSESISPLRKSSYVYAFSNQKESAAKIGVSTAETGSAWASPSSDSTPNLTGSAKKAPALPKIGLFGTDQVGATGTGHIPPSMVKPLFEGAPPARPFVSFNFKGTPKRSSIKETNDSSSFLLGTRSEPRGFKSRANQSTLASTPELDPATSQTQPGFLLGTLNDHSLPGKSTTSRSASRQDRPRSNSRSFVKKTVRASSVSETDPAPTIALDQPGFAKYNSSSLTPKELVELREVPRRLAQLEAQVQELSHKGASGGATIPQGDSVTSPELITQSKEGSTKLALLEAQLEELSRRVMLGGTSTPHRDMVASSKSNTESKVVAEKVALLERQLKELSFRVIKGEATFPHREPVTPLELHVESNEGDTAADEITLNKDDSLQEKEEHCQGTMTVEELKEECNSQGLSTSGKKSVLVARYVTFHHLSTNFAANQIGFSSEELNDEKRFQGMKKTALESECRSRHLPTTGVKAILVARLEAAAHAYARRKDSSIGQN